MLILGNWQVPHVPQDVHIYRGTPTVYLNWQSIWRGCGKNWCVTNQRESVCKEFVYVSFVHCLNITLCFFNPCNAPRMITSNFVMLCLWPCSLLMWLQNAFDEHNNYLDIAFTTTQIQPSWFASTILYNCPTHPTNDDQLSPFLHNISPIAFGRGSAEVLSFKSRH